MRELAGKDGILVPHSYLKSAAPNLVLTICFEVPFGEKKSNCFLKG